MIDKEKNTDDDCIEAEYNLEDNIAQNWLISFNQAEKYNKERNNKHEIQ